MAPRQDHGRAFRFEVEERQQKVADIEAMIEDFSRVAEELDRQVHYEEQRAGIHDPAHFAYPIYAKAARQRRDNLYASIRELSEKLEEAREALENARSELEAAEMAANRGTARSARRRSSGHAAIARD